MFKMLYWVIQCTFQVHYHSMAFEWMHWTSLKFTGTLFCIFGSIKLDDCYILTIRLPPPFDVNKLGLNRNSLMIGLVWDTCFDSSYLKLCFCRCFYRKTTPCEHFWGRNSSVSVRRYSHTAGAGHLLCSSLCISTWWIGSICVCVSTPMPAYRRSREFVMFFSLYLYLVNW